MGTSDIVFLAVLAAFVALQAFRLIASQIYRRRKAEIDRTAAEFLARACPNCGQTFGPFAFWILYGHNRKWWISPVITIVHEPDATGFERFINIGCHHCFRLFTFDRQGNSLFPAGIPVSDQDDSGGLRKSLEDCARLEREKGDGTDTCTALRQDSTSQASF